MKIFRIETKHSKWGNINLFATFSTITLSDGTVRSSYILTYPSGEFMGELDRDIGGGLMHPNEDISRFLREYAPRIDLCEIDPPAYYELEGLIGNAIHAHDPHFFGKATK